MLMPVNIVPIINPCWKMAINTFHLRHIFGRCSQFPVAILQTTHHLRRLDRICLKMFNEKVTADKKLNWSKVETPFNPQIEIN